MEAVWRFRIMLFTAFALIMFGDFFGYGSVRGAKTSPGRNPTTLQENHPEIGLDTDASINDLQTAAENQKNAKAKLSLAIRESCLPKMLCEMASRPEYQLSDKERELLHLIKSTTMSLAMNSPPTRWHFAAHMGELFRYTGDSISGPTGCSYLYPQCPFSSKKLLGLTYKINLK